jgi:hypothetical protein
MPRSTLPPARYGRSSSAQPAKSQSQCIAYTCPVYEPEIVDSSRRPVVAQKPIRSQRMLIRDRDSRRCSEICPFSEYGHRDRQNRVAILTGPWSMDCPTQWVEGTGATARFDDRCVLRLRDVRTDDGVHRPREMRRSCQRKAVGSSGDPDSLYSATGAFCSDDTTKQPNAHNTESREVLRGRTGSG